MIKNEYDRWAYESGFKHGLDKSISPPVKSQCDRYYYLGFKIARRK